ncbi:MAG: prephenate dehydrogenase [Bacillota bacterium]
MQHNFEQILIVGVGLIGGSLAAAFKQNNIGSKIIGIDREIKSLSFARKNNLIDSYFLDLDSLQLQEIDLIILAAPIQAIKTTISELARYPLEDTVIIDTGSTKKEIVKTMSLNVDPDNSIKWIGGHPMAGLEKNGVEWHSSTLFEESTFIFSPLNKNDVKTEWFYNLKNVFQKIGCNPLIIDAAIHDLYLAYISHLPQLLASTLFALVNRQEENKVIRKLAGNGFKDMTRLAASSPQLWQEIFISNKDNLNKIVDELMTELQAFQSALRENDSEKIITYLTNAKNTNLFRS